jgi:two-component system chemotaxis response regulator CheY
MSIGVIKSNQSEHTKRQHRLKNILVVDDSIMVRDLLKTVLSVGGYQVFEAATGEEALNICGLKHPDLIILDDNLPGINGISVAKELKNTMRIPFMVLTASNDEQQLREYITLGATNYIIKPIKPENIIPAVQSAYHNGTSIQNLVDKSQKDNYVGRAIACLMLIRGVDEAMAISELKKQARSERVPLWIKAREIFEACTAIRSKQ